MTIPSLRPLFRPEVRVVTVERPSLPLATALLCIDCESVWTADGGNCPACGSAECIPLARITERPASTAS